MEPNTVIAMSSSPVNRLENVKLWRRSNTPEVAEFNTTWGDTAKSWENSLEKFIAEHPRMALAAAAAAGLVLGWMVKRK